MDIFEQHEEFVKQLQELFTGIRTEVHLPLTPIQDITHTLSELGFSSDYEFDSNGWCIDFWCYYTHPELGIYVYAGSLQYGKCTISKKT